ncbi:MAG: Long-chain-fatty-acid--CoA ligase [Deltaproteobacteria bacterium ADurb.Bin510]|nr:MAG: Long-chain-fatty-acid--CoA ligase [Deltaproteobacteria bacterium ADurb.Bin510]
MEVRPWQQHYDEHVKLNQTYPETCIPDFLRQSAARAPERTAVFFGDIAGDGQLYSRRITYAELDELSDRFAGALQQDGFKPGDRVAFYMPNCPQYMIGYYGTLKAGGIVVPCNALMVAREVAAQVNNAGAEFLVVAGQMYAAIKAVRANTCLRKVVVTNVADFLPPEIQDGAPIVNVVETEATVWLSSFLKAPRGAAVAIDPSDSAILMYTGGTTGLPKGAELTHRNLVCNTLQMTNWMFGPEAASRDERIMTILPMSHSYAMTVCMNLAVFNGFEQIVIQNPKDFNLFLKTIDRLKPTFTSAVPAIYTTINCHPEIQEGRYDLKSIRIWTSGAASLPAEVQLAFENITGCKIIEGYGLSEASPVTHFNPVSGGTVGSIGLTLVDTDCKIVDYETETRTLAAGEEGILCVSGPQVMKGYWNNAEETAKVLKHDGEGKLWLHTGDVAVMDEKGYVRIRDRKKNLILASGGFNVYPREIEERLYEHPAVHECAVIGVPVGSPDQRIKAFIALKPGHSVSIDEIRSWCLAGLSRYKVPKFIEFCDEIPKTSVGKISHLMLKNAEAGNKA